MPKKRSGGGGGTSTAISPYAAQVGATAYAQALLDQYAPPKDTKAGSTVVVAPTLDEPLDEVERFLTVGPGSFTRAHELASAKDLEEAWNTFVQGAGIESLGVPTNWWPGLHADRPISHGIAQYGGWFAPGEDRPEAWAPPDTFHTFTNADDKTQQQKFWVRYDPTRGAQQYMVMGAAERKKYSTMMVKAGLLPEEWEGIGDFAPDAAAAFSQALSWANYWGTSVDDALSQMGGLFQTLNARRGGGGGGGAGPTVKIEVPDYETLVQEAKDLIQSKVGNRDVSDWELSLVADEFQRQYGRWAQATEARMIGGNGTYEIPDPVALTESFVETKYSDEISRLEDIGDTRSMNQLLIGAATKGTEMMGGLGG